MSDIKFRSKGFYWVKYDKSKRWQVMEWVVGNYWFRCGSNYGLDDVDLIEIGQRISRPDADKVVLDKYDSTSERLDNASKAQS